jgi:hypothetical protein
LSATAISLLPDAPSRSSSLPRGTPSKRTRSLSQGVVVSNETVPSASSISRSNQTSPPVLACAMFPDTTRIGFPEGFGNASAAAPPQAAIATINAAIICQTDLMFT